jgi:hypothetical protein
VWIRSSTGHLCIDLTPPETNILALSAVNSGLLPSGTSLFILASEPEMIMIMSLPDYHRICDLHLHRSRCWSVSPSVSVKLGSICYWLGPEYENSLEVASSNCSIADYGWATMDSIVMGNPHP